MVLKFKPFQVRGRTSLCALLVAATALVAPTATTPAISADAKLSTVAAHYKVSLNGFDVGTFDYSSEIQGQGYRLKSDVSLSLLLGAVSWRGLSQTEGATPSAPKPKSFGFDHQSTLKSGLLRLGFNSGAVETVTIDPPPPVVADMVPLQREHLKNVLDPLSAVLALTQDTGREPCDRRVPIFDGRQRFDLQLSARRQDGADVVCRVKYIPLGGYQANEATQALARSTGIEISFRRVPSAKLFVPQKVVLPTIAGAAEIEVQTVTINGVSVGQVASVD
jgi:hypothetical protein